MGEDLIRLGSCVGRENDIFLGGNGRLDLKGTSQGNFMRNVDSRKSISFRWVSIRRLLRHWHVNRTVCVALMEFDDRYWLYRFAGIN